MVRITDVIVVDWDFSTGRPCRLCGKEPADYWQMAKIRVRFTGIIPFTDIFYDRKQGKWVCLECLGNIICDIHGK